jgi:hypothetical protein
VGIGLASSPIPGKSRGFFGWDELTLLRIFVADIQGWEARLRVTDDIDQDTFSRKSTEIRDGLDLIKLQIEALDRSHDETAELAPKVFELSQNASPEVAYRRLRRKASNPRNRVFELQARRRNSRP